MFDCVPLKGDQNHDNWLFCLATLLSSTLVYNQMGVINEDNLAKLKYPFKHTTFSASISIKLHIAIEMTKFKYISILYFTPTNFLQFR